MFIVKKIQGTNIQTIKDIEYTPEQDVVTLLFGKNNDNPTQKSNGSGKSAMLEIISLGLRGTSIRPVRIDEIINNDETKATTRIEMYNNETGVLMVIEREFYKKSSNTVSLYMEKDGVALPESDYIQSSALEYKDFIFNQIGISENEFVNNFLLSKHQYKSFFDCSDREKKEIINNLSNAVIVDPAISKVEEDKADKENELSKINLELSKNEGAIEAINSQIAKTLEDSSVEKTQGKIIEIENKISADKEELIILEEKLENLESTLQSTDSVSKAVENVLVDSSSLSEIHENLDKLDISTNNQNAIDIFDFSARECGEAIFKNNKNISRVESLSAEVEALEKTIIKKRENLASLVESKNKLSSAVRDIEEKYQDQTMATHKKTANIRSEIRDIDCLILDAENIISTFTRKLNTLKGIIAGTIECPKCKHKFLLDGDLEKSKQEVAEVDLKISSANSIVKKETANKQLKQKEINDLTASSATIENQLNDKLESLDKDIKKLNLDIKTETESINEIESDITSMTDRISKLSREIDSSEKEVRDAIYNEIDRSLGALKRQIETAKSDISFKKSMIATLQDNIKTLKNSKIKNTVLEFKKSKEELEIQKEMIERRINTAKKELDVLASQKITFDEFKTHLANSKISALAFEINSFLEKVGTDIRIDISGFTTNKNGKVSDKIYTSIIRDGVDFGSLYKLSEGEKATIHVATILARQKLINSSADVSKGLNFLCIDEILDSIDYGGLNKIFSLINDYGVTSIIISHGNVVENYPHKIEIVKTNGVSQLNTNIN